MEEQFREIEQREDFERYFEKTLPFSLRFYNVYSAETALFLFHFDEIERRILSAIQKTTLLDEKYSNWYKHACSRFLLVVGARTATAGLSITDRSDENCKQRNQGESNIHISLIPSSFSEPVADQNRSLSDIPYPHSVEREKNYLKAYPIEFSTLVFTNHQAEFEKLNSKSFLG